MSFMSMLTKKVSMPSASESLPGRDQPIMTPGLHTVNRRPIDAAVPEGHEEVQLGLGCFWGAERLFWQTPGVYVTAVGYSGGHTKNPTYGEVCSGRTGHTETVRVVFDLSQISREQILQRFWEGHDPTQGMRQGNDIGTQYRSAIYYASDEMREAALKTKASYQQALKDAGVNREITTEIKEWQPFYYAEADHQQYLHKHPGGYCGLGGTGVSCPVGLGVSPQA